MIASLHKQKEINTATIKIRGSKSESNRLLILQALFPEITIENLSNSADTVVLEKALNSDHSIVDIHHAGTAMRFLTAYYAVKTDANVLLTGSARMKERPVEVLVNALQDLGASIDYAGEKGFPPLRINGAKQLKSKVKIDAGVSSQYISALMLVAPCLENGLQIELVGTITSRPYIEMTLQLLFEIGTTCSFSNQIIKISPLPKVDTKTIKVESDWSSASYFYSIVALSEQMSVTLSAYKKSSLQGDAELASIYEIFGVVTHFNDDETITISKQTKPKQTAVDFNLIRTPDIAQTIAVTCFGLNISCTLTGLHTLKIKETDRLQALKNELIKLGATIDITADSLHLVSSNAQITAIKTIATYQDHRMAMAFAPLAMLFPIAIEDAMVVSKSYPEFYRDIERVGISTIFSE